MNIKRENFPTDFVFGTATSSYQIEGGYNLDGRKPSIWDDFTRIPGNIKDFSSGDIACDHYHNFKSDMDLVNNVGFNAYRFSTSWSRVISNTSGKLNIKGLDFYDRLVDDMIGKNIDPYLTLYHWDLPSFLQENGGWLNRDTAKHFQDYAYLMVEKLGDRVNNWLTHNEMWCTSFLSHQVGIFAPGEKNLPNALTVAHHVLLSHGLALESMRDSSNEIKIGIAPNYLPCYPSSESENDVKAATLFDGYFNRWFLDPLTGRGYPKDIVEICKNIMPDIESGDMDIISGDLDILGVNYYNSNWFEYDELNSFFPCRKKQPDGLWETADRDVYAPGLYDTLERLYKDYKFENLYITENGAATNDIVEVDSTGNKVVHDDLRVRYLKEHFEQAQKAIKDGIPLKGYFVWSLMDNFEWAAGYTLRYGIHYTDYKTQERIPKDSAKWLKKILDV
ncbi:MAG: GH1 family beta-glucosidase [Spirochaetaceae bacterium]